LELWATSISKILVPYVSISKDLSLLFCYYH
jgi:hypothetical protein